MRLLTTVHPHACGEHKGPDELFHTISGSSPRMWGTRDRSLRRAPRYRFIPTHVGNTWGKFSKKQKMTVHPHACGEHFGKMISTFTWNGSSPRMWGTLGEHANLRWVWRFIPTHVGNTKLQYPVSSNITVHPHACGEHLLGECLAGSSHGSSPRMWGTLIYRDILTLAPRFIPTHVGNTGR